MSHLHSSFNWHTPQHGPHGRLLLQQKKRVRAICYLTYSNDTSTRILVILEPGRSETNGGLILVHLKTTTVVRGEDTTALRPEVRVSPRRC